MPRKLTKSILRFASYYPQFAFDYDNTVPNISMPVKPSCFTVDKYTVKYILDNKDFLSALLRCPINAFHGCLA